MEPDERWDGVRGGLESGDSFGTLGKSFSSITASARTRSSHLPRTASRLPPMRWEGVHRRVALVGADVLLPVMRELTVETEPDLERDPVFVEPRSRRRA